MATLLQQADKQGDLVSGIIKSFAGEPARRNVALESDFLAYCYENKLAVLSRKDAINLPMIELIRLARRWARHTSHNL